MIACDLVCVQDAWPQTTPDQPSSPPLTPPHPNPSLFPDEEERKKMKMRAMWTAGHWDKARPLLTCPRPSPRILPPTSIDYVVGGREAGLIIFFFHPLRSPPFPWFQQRHRQPAWFSALLCQTTYLPLTAAFADLPSSGLDIINGDHLGEWGIFFKNRVLLSAARAVRGYFFIFFRRPLRVVVWFSLAKKPVGGAGARSCSAPPNSKRRRVRDKAHPRGDKASSNWICHQWRWVVGLYVGVSSMCLFCRTPAVATQSLIEAGRMRAPWFVFAQLLPSAEHLTLPTCRCIPPAYLALECLNAGSCSSLMVQRRRIFRLLCCVMLNRSGKPGGTFHTYIWYRGRLKVGRYLSKLSTMFKC